MDLSGNNIKQLKGRQFVMSKDLKLLNLSSNSLQIIETGQKCGETGKKSSGWWCRRRHVSERTINILYRPSVGWGWGWSWGRGSLLPNNIRVGVFWTGREILSPSFILPRLSPSPKWFQDKFSNSRTNSDIWFQSWQLFLIVFPFAILDSKQMSGQDAGPGNGAIYASVPLLVLARFFARILWVRIIL